MRETLLVAEREFNERVRTRSFVIGTALLPVVVLAIVVLPGLSSGGAARHLVVVDQAPAPIGDVFVTSLNAGFLPGLDSLIPAPRRRNAGRYEIERTRRPLDQVRGELASRMAAEEIDAWVALPPDIRESAPVRLSVRSASDAAVFRDVRAAANDAVQADRLARSGLRLPEIVALLAPVSVETLSAGEAVPPATPRRESIYFAIATAILTYLMIALYGTGVTRSVLEEKNNRIAEVLVSSMRATHLLAGKVLGVGSAVLLQVLIWIAVFGLMVGQSEWIAARFGTSPAVFQALLAAPGTTTVLLAYFILGFLLFAAVFAGLGAAVTSDQEAQAFQMLLMLPLFVPVVFLLQLTTRPYEPLARLLGLFPFTSPVAMPVRMASAHIPTWEVLLSLALLVLALVGSAWLAGKVYRVGILATGRKPTLRELLHWLRAG
jgi:ABC-2 type transport system permease protein